MEYKNYKVRIGMVVHTYTDVMAPSEDEAKWEVFDTFKSYERNGAYVSFVKDYFDEICYAEPEDLHPVLGLYECEDYDPFVGDRKEPSETEECA